MDVQEIEPGLWRWTGWHEEWKDDVGCVYYETPETIVLIDPILPPEAPDRFWQALDRDVDRGGKPLHVLITIFWHARSASAFVERYGARVWAPRRGRAPVRRRVGRVDDVLAVGDVLHGGIEAVATGRNTEVAFLLTERLTLVPGDALIGDGSGGLRLCPTSWLPSSIPQERLRSALRPLLDRQIERVLVSHGAPVLSRAHEALARALAAEPGV